MLWRGAQCTAGDKKNKFGTVPDPMIITGFALTLCDACGTSALSRAMLSVDSAAEHNGLSYSIWMGFKTKQGGG